MKGKVSEKSGPRRGVVSQHFGLSSKVQVCLFCFTCVFRSEVTRLEQVVEDLKSQLRMHDSIPTHDGGLSGGDIVFSASVQNTLQAAIDKLTKYTFFSFLCKE